MIAQEFNRFLPQDVAVEDHRTDFQKAQAALRNGHVLNCCKTDGFGCPDEALWEHGYCRHLVGFTLPGDNKVFHPIKERGKTGSKSSSFKFIDGDDPQPVLPSDKLVPVTEIFSRVYRDVDVKKKTDKAAA